MNKYSFPALILALSLMVLYILQDFILPVTLGAIVSLLLYKPTKILSYKIKNYKIASLITTSVIGSLVFLTFGFLLFTGTNEVINFLQQNKNLHNAQNLIEQLKSYIPVIQNFVPISADQINTYFYSSAQYLMSKALVILQNLGLQIPTLLMDLLIIVISSYLFLVEQDKINKLVVSNKFFTKEQTRQIYQSVVSTTNSVVIASLFSGFLQAIVMGIAASILVPEKILLISILTFLFSFIPFIGTAPITLTLLLVNFFNQDYMGVSVVVISVGFLALIDNLLKPLLIGNKINIHPILAFLSALGGLSLFGFYGLFLGPILVGILFSLIKNKENGFFKP
jgi:predicted PurR-regulated permease PerM